MVIVLIFIVTKIACPTDPYSHILSISQKLQFLSEINVLPTVGTAKVYRFRWYFCFSGGINEKETVDTVRFFWDDLLY